MDALKTNISSPIPRLKPLFLRHAAFSLVNGDIISRSQAFASQYSTNLCVELVMLCSDVCLCPMDSVETASHYCISHCSHKCTEGLGLSERLLLDVNSCMLVDICWFYGGTCCLHLQDILHHEYKGILKVKFLSTLWRYTGWGLGRGRVKAVLIFNICARRWWVVKFTTPVAYPKERSPVPIEQGAVWIPVSGLEPRTLHSVA